MALGYAFLLFFLAQDASGSLENVVEWQDSARRITLIESELLAATAARNELRQQLEITRQHLDAVSSRIVPVGSVYIGYHNQPSPVELWPELTWEDISFTYAGLFFRASGGSAAEWGTTQTDCSPRITDMNYRVMPNISEVKNPMNLRYSGGWSEYFNGGTFYTGATAYWEGLRYKTEACEVRPVNQAVRMWKRIA